MSFAFSDDNISEQEQDLYNEVLNLRRENQELKEWKKSVQEYADLDNRIQYLYGKADKLQGCSSGACLVEKTIGMHTNGGNCHCSKETLKAKLRRLQQKLYKHKIEWTTNE